MENIFFLRHGAHRIPEFLTHPKLGFTNNSHGVLKILSLGLYFSLTNFVQNRIDVYSVTKIALFSKLIFVNKNDEEQKHLEIWRFEN